MIPEQTYPELGGLINALPELFKHSEIIGVFLGNEICASLMHNAALLDKVVLYENFIDIPDPQHQENLKELYKSWEAVTPNLTVSISDGAYFDVTADFIYHDMKMALSTFVVLYKDLLKDALLGNCCFGNAIYSTTEYIDCIRGKIIFPVLLCRDILLYTFNEEKKDKLIELISARLLENNLVFDYDFYDQGNDYDEQGKVIRLHSIKTYEGRLNEKFAAT